MRADLREGVATFSPLGRSWGRSAHGGPIVRFSSKRRTPFDQAVSFEITGHKTIVRGQCSPAQLESFARELRALLLEAAGAARGPATADGRLGASLARDIAASRSPQPVAGFLRGVTALLPGAGGLLDWLFGARPASAPLSHAVLIGQIDGRRESVLQVSLREMTQGCLLRVDFSFGESTAPTFSNPQAVAAFIEELRDSGLTGV